MNRIAIFAALMFLAGCMGTTDRSHDPSGDCRCEGAVPGGHLSAACGEAVCVDGTHGYLCTGPNAAVAQDDACLGFGDGGPAPAPDAGPADDGGPTPTPDAGPSPHDAGHPTPDAGCTTHTYYRDADGDGYGDPSATMDACEAPFGYVTSDGDCLDSDASVHPGADELCDGRDDNCDGTSPACSGLDGSYTGTYDLDTAERLGSSIINEMHCTGTASLSVDVSASPALSGTVTCDYTGGLVAFAAHQTGTVVADIRPDGTVSGSVTHVFDPLDSSETRTFTFTGTIAGSHVDVTGTGSWLPNPMSAVPWDVSISMNASR